MHCCCCSVTKLCPTLCEPMSYNTSSFPVLLYLPVFTKIYVYQYCYLTISSSAFSFSFCLQFFPASGSFPMSYFFISGGQSFGASASASVLPMNIQDWFPLGLTGLMSLLSKGLSRVFSSTMVQFFSTQLSLWVNIHISTWLLGKS